MPNADATRPPQGGPRGPDLLRHPSRFVTGLEIAEGVLQATAASFQAARSVKLYFADDLSQAKAEALEATLRLMGVTALTKKRLKRKKERGKEAEDYGEAKPKLRPKAGADASVVSSRSTERPPGPIKVTDDSIRDAMKDASLVSQQSKGISRPVVERYVRLLEAGNAPPPIKVDGKIIVDGNHRYVAGRVFGKETEIQPWVGRRPDRVVPWDSLPISPKDWGNQ